MAALRYRIARKTLDLVGEASVVVGDELFEHADAVLQAGDVLVEIADDAAELDGVAFSCARGWRGPCRAPA